MSVEALLFDLGGVVIEIDFGRAVASWAAAAGVPVDDIRARFSFDEAYQRHERGEIAGEEYFAALRSSLRTLRIDLPDAALALYPFSRIDTQARPRKFVQSILCESPQSCGPKPPSSTSPVTPWHPMKWSK